MNIYIPIKDYSAMQWPAPEWFHVPLATEREWLKTIMDWLGLTTWDNWRINLHMPFAGYRHSYNSSLNYQGSTGVYWSSSPRGSSYPSYASSLSLNSSSVDADYGNGVRAYGYSVRCFKNSFELPTSSWTVINGTLWSAWIFWDTVNWLISITGDGTTWYTIQDKNLWATTVYNNGDTLTQANMWNMYQWWNNYWFPSTWNVATSSTQVNAQNYWPWNYYSSSTFITRSTDWSYVHNDNLRWWVTWVVTKPKEVQNIYIGEKPPRTFTVTWTEASDPTQFNPTYSDDAAWLTAWSTDFDDFFWYYGCRLSNAGVETAKQSQSAGVLDITQLGTLTSWDNVMIAFPRRWIKMTKSWTTVTLSITEEPNKDWYQYYAHTKGSDAKDILYLWAYKMVSWYKSLSWAYPLVNLTRDWFRQWVKNTYDSSAWTNRYSQISIYARWYINALYMMKYGNPDSQSVIWAWYTWGSAAVDTWNLNIQKDATWWNSYNKLQCKLFWLEDWWWNVYEFLDCCLSGSNSMLTVDKTNSVFKDDSFYDSWIWQAVAWYMAWIGWSNDTMFMNVNKSWWSSTAYYTDYVGAGSWLTMAGGSYSDNYSGVFWSYNTYASESNAKYGARLMYL